MCTGQGNQLMNGLPGANTTGSLGSIPNGAFPKVGNNGPYNRPFSYAPASGPAQAHQFFDGTGPVFGGNPPPTTPPGTPPPVITPPPGGTPPPPASPPTSMPPVMRPPSPVLGGVTSVGPAGPYPGAAQPPGATTPPPTPPGLPPPPVNTRPGLSNNNKIGFLGGAVPGGPQSDMLRGSPTPQPTMNFGAGQDGAQTFANFASQGGMGNLPLRDQMAQNFGGDTSALSNWYNSQSYGPGGQAVQQNGSNAPAGLDAARQLANGSTGRILGGPGFTPAIMAQLNAERGFK